MVTIHHNNLLYSVLFGAASLYSMHEAPLVLELAVRNVMDHNLVCALSLVNKDLNSVARNTIEQRKALLQPQLDVHQCVESFFVWHSLGSAVSYIDLGHNIEDGYKMSAYTENPFNVSVQVLPKKSYNPAHLCYVQLAVDGIVCNRYSIAWHIDWSNFCLKPARDMARIRALQESRIRYKSWGSLYKSPDIQNAYNLILIAPYFTGRGEARTYVYKRHNSHNGNKHNEIIQYGISPSGIKTSHICYFSYNDQKYPLQWLKANKLLVPFTRAKWVEQTETDIIFRAEGMLINGKPLSPEQHEEIQSIIAKHKEKSS